MRYLVDKDGHSECWSGQVGIQLVQVVLPLPLPGQVHQGRPLAPPQLYQLTVLINTSVEAQHLKCKHPSWHVAFKDICVIRACHSKIIAAAVVARLAVVNIFKGAQMTMHLFC